MSLELSIKTSESVAAIAPAFVSAQAKVMPAAKDSENPHFRSKYADLASVMHACKDALNENGIGVIQSPAPADGTRLKLETRLIHKSGEWFSGTMEMPLVKSDPQAYGSSLTYARRYALAAMVGVCPEDDDANGAMPEPGNTRGQRKDNPPSRQSAQSQKKAAPSAPQMSDEQYAEFERDLPDIFSTQGFDKESQERAIAAVCKKKGVAGIRQLSSADAQAFIKAIMGGQLEAFKKGSPNKAA
ncbi:MAG: ERF family protein [Phycisphaerae bacterium]|nr:ERF family protein [Phycisphaerae bacterium]